jgi:hypothetical protein
LIRAQTTSFAHKILTTSEAPYPTMPRSYQELTRNWPNSYDVKYPPLDQLERDMQHINTMVTSGKLPVNHLLLVVELWSVYQRGPYLPLAARVFNNIIYAYSKLNAHMLAISLYMAFPTVKWRSMANEAVKRSALQMAHPDAYVEALQRQESSGRAPSRPDLEGLAVVCIRAKEYSRALAVLKQLEQLPGELSPRVYKEMVISATAVGDSDRAARAVLSLAQALLSQERELAAAVQEVLMHPDKRTILERKWPDWLAKCLRMPERVALMCLRREDSDSCFIAVHALQTLGMNLHKELAEDVLEFASHYGHAMLAERAALDIIRSSNSLTTQQQRCLVRAYANSEDVEGAFRAIQAFHLRQDSPIMTGLDERSWEAVVDAVVCLNNRVFLSGRQLRAKAMDCTPASEGTSELQDISALSNSSTAASSQAVAPVTEADIGGAEEFLSSDQQSELVAQTEGASLTVGTANIRSLLGFGFVSEPQSGDSLATSAGSAMDLLLPERRSNRWHLYNHAASLGLGIPEIALSFAANACEDLWQLHGTFEDELVAFHSRVIADVVAAHTQTRPCEPSDVSTLATYSERLSALRVANNGSLMRGRTIEEVLSSNMLAREAYVAKPPSASRYYVHDAALRICNPVLNLVVGSLPRCRAGAFVAPTFQQVSACAIHPHVCF